MQLYTGTYQRFTPDLGVPVRSTLGAPRFALKYELSPIPWRSVAPPRAIFRMDRDPFRSAYLEHLDALGLDRIMSEAEAYERHHGDGRIVALCFDDLRKPGMWCHRQFFGQWLTDQGVPVIELFPADGPADPPRPRKRTSAAAPTGSGGAVTADTGLTLQQMYPPPVEPTQPRLF